MMIFVRWQFPCNFWKWKQGWLWKTFELLKENKDYIFEQAKYELIYLKKSKNNIVFPNFIRINIEQPPNTSSLN
jgi:hypothetical protein